MDIAEMQAGLEAQTVPRRPALCCPGTLQVGGKGSLCAAASNATLPWTVESRPLCPWDSPGKNTGVGASLVAQW